MLKELKELKRINVISLIKWLKSFKKEDGGFNEYTTQMSNIKYTYYISNTYYISRSFYLITITDLKKISL